MVLLIIVYRDDIGGFNLYPLQEPKHEHHNSYPQITTGPSHSTATLSSFAIPPPASGKMLVPEETGGAVVEEEGRDKQEQRKEKTKEDVEEERSHTAVDVEQEVRKKRVIDMCSGKGAVEFPGRTRAFGQIPNRELDHLIVDDTHQIIYCYVPKVQLPCSCMCICVVLV